MTQEGTTRPEPHRTVKRNWVPPQIVPHASPGTDFLFLEDLTSFEMAFGINYDVVPAVFFKGMSGYNRLLASVMLEPVTTLSDDDGVAGVPKAKAKSRSSTGSPKAKPKATSKPKAAASKPKAAAKPKSGPNPKPKSGPPKSVLPSASSSPAKKRPAAAGGGGEVVKKRPAAAAPEPVRISKYFYKQTKIWGFKLDGKEKFRVPHLQQKFWQFTLTFLRPLWWFVPLHWLRHQSSCFCQGKTPWRGIGWEDRRDCRPWQQMSKTCTVTVLRRKNHSSHEPSPSTSPRFCPRKRANRSWFAQMVMCLQLVFWPILF